MPSRCPSEREIEIAAAYLSGGKEAARAIYKTKTIAPRELKITAIERILASGRDPSLNEVRKMANDLKTNMDFIRLTAVALIKAGWRPENYHANTFLLYGTKKQETSDIAIDI